MICGNGELGNWGVGCGVWELWIMKWGRWGSGEAVSSHPITPKPYHPKTLSPQNPITRTMFTDRPET
ncbi:hypothetical protein C789_914 [Microcystis aeruginosa FACHB-905 = DIANCHI905]|nr:hypothetical protein C789_914 [Microcystis aeruginosa FACHB-905 = DIANCHI905]